MTLKNLLKIAVGTGLILLIPVVANWPWTAFDFVFMGVLLFGSGSAFTYLITRPKNISYKLAGGLTALTSFFLVWVNAAVGIIGEDNPVNMLYPLLVLVLIIGATIVRAKAKAMSTLLFVVTGLQLLVPFIGLLIMRPDFAPGVFEVFVLNGFFAGMWFTAAILFRDSSE